MMKEKSVVVICEDGKHPILRLLRSLSNGDKVVDFRSNEEFDAWRARQRCPNNLRREVVVALRELGVDEATLSAPTRKLLRFVALCEVAPTVPQLHENASRRTLYRYWDSRLERPSRFLTRVRVLRAQALERAALELKAVALSAGFRNVRHMKVSAQRFGKTIGPNR